MAALYRVFAEEWSSTLDFSDQALLSLYNHESYGTSLSTKNGFAVGKQYLNLQVTMWKEDLRSGSIFKWELYEDPRFPHEWLDSVLSNLWSGRTYDDVLNETRLGTANRSKNPK